MPLIPSITVRCAQPADLDVLVGLLAQLFALEADFSFCERKQRAGLMLLMAQTNASVFVAEVAGKVRGMCTVQLVVSTAEGALSGWIEDMVVHRSWRGIGIGAELLGNAAAWAAEEGATRLQLLADRQNKPALAFYKHLGWTPTQLVALRSSPQKIVASRAPKRHRWREDVQLVQSLPLTNEVRFQTA